MEQKINVTIPPEVAGGKYSNLTIITHTQDEFVLDFARNLPGLPSAEVVARLIMTPVNAKRFLDALSENIAKYESKFGSITAQNGTFVVPAGGYKA